MKRIKITEDKLRKMVIEGAKKVLKEYYRSQPRKETYNYEFSFEEAYFEEYPEAEEVPDVYENLPDVIPTEVTVRIDGENEDATYDTPPQYASVDIVDISMEPEVEAEVLQILGGDQEKLQFVYDMFEYYAFKNQDQILEEFEDERGYRFGDAAERDWGW